MAETTTVGLVTRCTLTTLPTDIWVKILPYLKPHEILALTLVNREFADHTGWKLFWQMKKNSRTSQSHGHDWNRFKALYDHAYADKFLCYRCNRYHSPPPKHGENYFHACCRGVDLGALRPGPGLLRCSFDTASFVNKSSIHFAAVQLTLRAHRTPDRYGMSLKAFERACLVAFKQDLRTASQRFWLPRVKAIVEPHANPAESRLLVRFSIAIDVFHPQLQTVENVEMSARPWDTLTIFPKCEHIVPMYFSLDPSPTLHYTSQTRNSIGYLGCPRCATEFFFENLTVRPPECTQDLAIPAKAEVGKYTIVTMWKDFGTGHSPYDPEWMSHCGWRSPRRRSAANRDVAKRFQKSIGEERDLGTIEYWTAGTTAGSLHFM